MDAFLLGGYMNTGKSTSTIRLAIFLMTRGFVHVAGDPIPLVAPAPGTKPIDIRVLIENPISKKRVLLNSGSDYGKIALELETFYNAYPNIDVIITTIRDSGNERADFLTVLNRLLPNQMIELPLAKINGQRINSDNIMREYLDTIENLSRFILTGIPFNL